MEFFELLSRCSRHQYVLTQKAQTYNLLTLTAWFQQLTDSTPSIHKPIPVVIVTNLENQSRY